MPRTIRRVGLITAVAVVALVALVVARRVSTVIPDTLLNAPTRIVTRWIPPTPPATLNTVTDAERETWRELGERLVGQLVWSSNREGNHELYLVDLETGGEQRLTTHPHVDFFSRFSPDGQQISFLRSQREWVSFRDEEAWDLYVMNVDGTGERLLVNGAYHPTWLPDGSGLVYVYLNEVFQFDLATNARTLIYAATEGRVFEPELSEDGRLAVTWRYIPQESVGVIDLRSGRYLPLSTERSCQVTWFPGRQQAVWIDPGGIGGTQVMTGTFTGDDSRTETLIDLPGSYSHEYFPKVSADGEWLVWGASAEGHEHDRADYELFIWKIGSPADSAIRWTYSPANDQWPDLFVP